MVPPMPNPRLWLPLLLLVGLALPACGSGTGRRNRPFPLASLPADGAVIDNVVA